MSFALQPVDSGFFETAPHIVRHSVDIAVTPDRVWAAIAADDAIMSWSKLLSSLQWTSSRPFGVGTTRRVSIQRVVTINEHYFRWEEGRRQSFYVTASSAPGLRRFAEDYLIEDSERGARFTWTVAFEPTLLLKVPGPLMARFVDREIKNATHALKPHLER